MSFRAANSDRHAEQLLVKNLRAMRTPTALLKCGATGKPKFRTFVLSPDMGYLTWESKNKRADQTRVRIADIREVRYGQRTDKFARAKRPDLESLSFSLVYHTGSASGGGGGGSGSSGAGSGAGGAGTGGSGSSIAGTETLDLVCKDEKEFQVWANTLFALASGKVERRVVEEAERMGKLSPTAATTVSSPSHKKGAKSMSARMGPGAMDGDAHGQVSSTNNDVYVFGASDWGQLGLNLGMSANKTPKLSEQLLGQDVVQVACAWSHTTVLTESCSVLQCGNRLGTGLDQDYIVPTVTAGITEKLGVAQIACGAYHTLALTENNEVLAWGCNYSGQLGLGHERDVRRPTPVRALAGKAEYSVRRIAAGEECSAVLVDAGRVYTWGAGKRGQLGHGDTANHSEPTLVSFFKGTDVQSIAMGGSHAFATTDRELYAWGSNFCGQLGLGHTNDVLTPHAVETLRGSKVVDLACGAAHSAAIILIPRFGSHVLYTWGSNACGQLGHEKKANFTRPTPVRSKDTEVNMIEVSCGDMHTVVRSERNGVWTAGANGSGQLGLGHTKDMATFTRVIAGLKDKEVRSVRAGGCHTAVLTARAWVADSEAKECMSCKTGFTFVNRKHHCRNCGGIFCGKCSDKKIAILKLGIMPVRVCAECYTKLGGR